MASPTERTFSRHSLSYLVLLPARTSAGQEKAKTFLIYSLILASLALHKVSTYSVHTWDN